MLEENVQEFVKLCTGSAELDVQKDMLSGDWDVGDGQKITMFNHLITYIASSHRYDLTTVSVLPPLSRWKSRNCSFEEKTNLSNVVLVVCVKK